MQKHDMKATNVSMTVFKMTLISWSHRIETPRLCEIINSKQEKKSWAVWKARNAKQIGRENCEVHVFCKIFDWLRLEQALFLCANSLGKKWNLQSCEEHVPWLRISRAKFQSLFFNENLNYSKQPALSSQEWHKNGACFMPLEINNYSENWDSQSIKQIRYCGQIAMCKWCVGLVVKDAE